MNSRQRNRNAAQNAARAHARNQSPAVEEASASQLARANTIAPLARENEYQQEERDHGAITALSCYLCVAPEHRMEEAPDQPWPIRKIVRRQTGNRADPTESYTLECGHTII